MSNIGALKRQAELLLDKIENGNYYAIKDLNNRLQKVASDNLQDTVIRAFAQVVEQIYKREPDKIISQGEVDKIYNQLIGLNASGTRFREVLGDILLSEPDVKSTRDTACDLRANANEMLNYDVDPELKNDLSGIFNSQSDTYDTKLASKSKEKVGLELKSLGFSNPKVHVAGGNSQFIICTAEFDTRKGLVRVLIPVEASGEKLPTVFYSDGNLKDLTQENLKNHIEDIVSKSEQIPHSTNEISMPRVQTPEPLKLLASDMEESVLETSVGYPQQVVRMAKQMLERELLSMGFKGSQTKVSTQTQDGFICNAFINSPRGKIVIEVPIEIKGNTPLMPSVFACGDFIDEFSQSKLHAFAMKGSELSNAKIQRDSSLADMNLHQLKDIIIRSAIKEDFNTCNEVMETIYNGFDDETYRAAAADYYKLLSNLKTMRESEKCAYEDSNQFVKTPNSMYPIHKKLGRPAHELIRDENGEYHVKSTYLSRQNQADSGAFFSNAKVLVGD